MARRPTNALCDGVDMSQHIRDAPALARTVLPGGKNPLEFVVRYTSVDTTSNPQKQLTDADIASCRTSDLSLVLVHEEGARSATGTYADGQADAAQALAFCRSKGMPPDVVVHGAIDFDAAGPDVAEYVRGFGDRMGRGQRAMYGGIKPLRYLFDHDLIDYGWQTYAWSGGLWDPRITAAQWLNSQSLAGNTVDYDSACAVDYGQLGPNWTSTDRGIMTEMDLTPAAIEAVRKAIWTTRVDSGAVAPPGGDGQVTALQAERMDYYRINGLANTFWPAVLDANGNGMLADVLAQAQANGSGITDIKTMLGSISTGGSAAGLDAKEMAAAFRAAADDLDPPVATS